MKAKAFAIALIAAICYSSLVCIKAHADEPTLEYKTQCINFKYTIIETVEVVEHMEEQGLEIPPAYIQDLLDAAIRYETHCSDVTGTLYSEEEY